MHWFLPGANELPTQRLLQAPGSGLRPGPRPRPAPRPGPRPRPGSAEAPPTSTSRPRPGRAEARSGHPNPLGAMPTRFLSPWGVFILKEELDMMGIKPQDLSPAV